MPPGAEDRLGHLVQVVVDDLDHLRGRLRLGEAREAPQIGEEDRAVALDSTQAEVLVRAGKDLVDHIRRYEAREHVTDALTLERFVHVEHGERAERAQSQREERVDEGDDQPAVERDLNRDREQGRERQRVEQRAPAPHLEAPERDDRPEQADQQDVQPARREPQRPAAEHGVHRVGPDFRSRHLPAVRRRRRMDVAEDRRGGADDHGLALDRLRVEMTVEDLRVGDRVDRFGWPAEVDREFPSVEQAGRDRMAGRDFGGYDGEAAQAVVGVADVPRHAVAVDLDVRSQPHVAGAGADFSQDRRGRAEEHTRRPAAFHLVGREHDFPVRAFDRFDERDIVGFVAAFGELEVDRDRASTRPAQLVDHTRVIAARIGKPVAGASEFVERRVVNGDEHDVLRRLAGAPDREPGVDRLQLAAAQQVRGVGRDAQAGGQ